MDATIWVSIIGLIGAGIGGWWQYFTTIKKLKIENQQKHSKKTAINQSIESMRAHVEVSALLFKLQTLGFARVLIVAFGNSGKIPKVGGDYYAKAIDTSTFSKQAEHKILDRYASVKVDSDYIDFCSKLCMNNDYRHHYVVPKDVEDSNLTLLQGWYKSEKVSESYILHIATDAQSGDNETFRMYILSLGFYNFQDYDLEKINWSDAMIYINKIRDIYKTHYSV